MSSNRLDVQWVPGMSDYLVTWSTDLKLYRILPTITPGSGPPTSSPIHASELWQQHPIQTGDSVMKVSYNSVAELQCQIPEPPHYIKCLAVHPLPGRHGDVRVAVGQANGRVSLLSFVPQMTGHSIKEFGPKQGGRPCNSLAWNNITPEFLAGGFEKNRNDHAILIFDNGRSLPPPPEFISMVPTTTSGGSGSIFKSAQNKDAATRDNAAPPAEYIRASIEIGLGETCHSLSWFHDHPDTIVAGMNSKNLKIFDVRCCDGSSSTSRKPSTSNFTRAVYGVCVDPWLDYRLASHHENHVVIWDTRNFDKPIVTLTQPRNVVKLSWCPSRSGLLCSVTEKSCALTLHDVQSWAVMSEDGEPVVTERNVECCYSEKTDLEEEDEESGGAPSTLSFAWHPSEESVIMAIGRGGKLAECNVPERITPSWSSRHCLIWPQKGILRSFGRSTNLCESIGDISVVMQDRAVQGCYTSKVSKKSLQTVLEPTILSAWVWLEECGKLMQDLSFRNKFSRTVTFPGIRTALGLDRVNVNSSGVGPRSDIIYRHWNIGAGSSDSQDENVGRPKKTFRSEGRENALRLCGWGVPDVEPDLKRFLKTLEASGQYSRAAAIAVFCLEIRLALKILQQAGKDGDNSPSLRIVAVALSGFSLDNTSLWRDSVSVAAEHLPDPYIRAMFAFLLAATSQSPDTDESYSVVLQDPNLKIMDKIAFACLYLPDAKLADFVNSFWKEAKTNGYLAGLFLCGMTNSNECVELLQNYLDLTGDVQTASWLAVKAMPIDLALSSDAVQTWISSYRQLLDSWGLWAARAEFDIALHKAGINQKHPQQVYVSCNFCGSSVAHQVKRAGGGTGGGFITSQNLSNVVATAPNELTYDDGTILNVIKKGAIDFIGLQRPNRKSVQTPQLNVVQAPQQASQVQQKRPSALRGQACPACRKPLPRCSVCLIHMGGMSSGVEGGYLMQKLSPKKRTKPFGLFFTWCQTCRHGGHASHLMDWFSEHHECPVNGCTCRCGSMDASLTIENPANIDCVEKDFQRLSTNSVKAT